jgi:hypothetical protein
MTSRTLRDGADALVEAMRDWADKRRRAPDAKKAARAHHADL